MQYGAVRRASCPFLGTQGCAPFRDTRPPRWARVGAGQPRVCRGRSRAGPSWRAGNGSGEERGLHRVREPVGLAAGAGPRAGHADPALWQEHMPMGGGTCQRLGEHFPRDPLPGGAGSKTGRCPVWTQVLPGSAGPFHPPPRPRARGLGAESSQSGGQPAGHGELETRPGDGVDSERATETATTPWATHAGERAIVLESPRAGRVTGTLG